MAFQIKKPEPIRKSLVRTLRFQPKMYDQLLELTEKHNISFHFLACQCIQYALDNPEKR